VLGCWTQRDTIWIGADGTVEFTSTVVVEDPDKELSFSDTEELSREFMKDLIDSNWQITRTSISKERPYRMEFVGSGNLKDVSPSTIFYELEKINEGEFTIRFLPAEREGRKSSRSIVFKRKLLASDATVYNPAGKEVREIPNVDERVVYTIKL
jgi:hypothetical protein